MITQNFDKSDLICSFKTKKIKFESDEPIKWTLDGEFGGEHNEAVFEVLHQVVEFIVPTKDTKEIKEVIESVEE